jgi:hypothetical protein
MFKKLEPEPHVVRMHAAVASPPAKRKQVAISGPAWDDWLTITSLQFVGEDLALFKANHSGGAHTGSDIYFEANALRGVRVL